MTTDVHINIAKQFAKEIGTVYGVKSIDVDDYNQYQSFAIIAHLPLIGDGKYYKYDEKYRGDFNLRKLSWHIKRVAKKNKNVRIEYIEMPTPTTEQLRGLKVKTTYEKPYVYISVFVD